MWHAVEWYAAGAAGFWLWYLADARFRGHLTKAMVVHSAALALSMWWFLATLIVGYTIYGCGRALTGRRQDKRSRSRVLARLPIQ